MPYGSKAADALDCYLTNVRRRIGGPSRALFLNHRGKRITDRGARNIVKFYATRLWAIRPSIPTLCAMRSPRIC